jgi:hypothetical protein
MTSEYTEKQLTQDIAATGKTAPRITPEHIDQVITAEQYWQPDGTTMTVCMLSLVNGFQVIGYSAAASPDNFDATIGRKLAFDDARGKIWVLEGYLLRQVLHDQQTHPMQSISLDDPGEGDDTDERHDL